jgi:transcriptional regulator
MLEQPVYAAGRDEVRALIADRGWATLVSGRPQPVVSHLPIILASDDPDDLTVLGHLARRDAQLHELGRHDAVLIIEGPEGYISPTFYAMEPYVPTWNFVVAHLHGRPEPLGGEETWSILERTVEHFEAARPVPWRLDSVEEYALSIAPQTTGFRLTPIRVVGKAKLNQDKPAEAVDRVIHALETDPVHAQPSLAAAMRAHGLSSTTKRAG